MMEIEAKEKKEALKSLRQERSAVIDRAKAAIKQHNQLIKKIKDQIKTQGKTVPEIAQETNMPTAQVLMFLSTLRKYGEVVEGDKDGDYFKFQVAG
jgi:predicted Rossmann fold nucleotide-binding protein DprA/Smf involved in DNA uptake